LRIRCGGKYMDLNVLLSPTVHPISECGKRNIFFFVMSASVFTFHSHFNTNAVMTADRISSFCVDIVPLARRSLCLLSPELSLNDM
jgi:hypothetical protein